ncbi:SCO family protein [Agarivorans sp. TSD2052]|uniref:SCO family protein n=1 Tax=Agarivorans sp. TSD2052 TaxID=2937286 RepID=UPI00200D9618|nr:SCO family protein [Agarivorans sp. TSD2052]UPW16754.1 SCO family protein [Agarivorans sp. TSD2052]
MVFDKKTITASCLILLAIVLIPLLLVISQIFNGGYGLKTSHQMVDFKWQDVSGDWQQFSQWVQGPSYVFLGFLGCSEVCSMRIGQMGQLNSWLDSLPASQGQKVNFLFITIDPDNDTPSIRAQLIDSRSDRFFSATLPPSELTKLQYSLREKLNADEATLNHVGNLYLFSSNATLQRIYTQWQLSVESMQADLQPLL